MIWHRPQRWKQLVSSPVEVIIAQARLYRPVDGDSFDLICNLLRRSNWRHAQVVGIRLKGYRARERHDNAAVDPAGADRVPGLEATQITTNYLTQSSRTLVEFTGLNSLDREVCDVWITLPGTTAPQAFGAVLIAAHVVIPGNTVGIHE